MKAIKMLWTLYECRLSRIIKKPQAWIFLRRIMMSQKLDNSIRPFFIFVRKILGPKGAWSSIFKSALHIKRLKKCYLSTDWLNCVKGFNIVNTAFFPTNRLFTRHPCTGLLRTEWEMVWQSLEDSCKRLPLASSPLNFKTWCSKKGPMVSLLNIVEKYFYVYQSWKSGKITDLTCPPRS